MLKIIGYVVEKYNNIFVILSGVFVTLFYLLSRKNEKLSKENTELKIDLETTIKESDKISDIQRKQAEVASSPSPSWDDIHKWLRDLATDSKKK